MVGHVLVVALSMLLIVFIAALVMAHVALPEMRQGNTLFVRDNDNPIGGARADVKPAVATRLRVPLGWSEPIPGPRHAR